MLIPSCVYVGWVIKHIQQPNPWQKVCDAHLLAALGKANTLSSKRMFAIASILFCLISIFALAGPAVQKRQTHAYRDIRSLSIVVDLSSDMLETDIKPDRLTRTKLKIRDLISSATNTEMGLVVFTDEAFVVSPITQDAKTLDTLIDELNPNIMPVAGARIDQGLQAGLKLLQLVHAKGGDVVLLTANSPNADSLMMAKNIAHAGMHLRVMPMLSENANTKETLDKLKQLALLGNGSLHVFAEQQQDSEWIIQNSAKHVSAENSADNIDTWQDLGPWVSLLLIPILLIALRETRRHAKHT
jgi:Ca-activated chloride channel family protein